MKLGVIIETSAGRLIKSTGNARFGFTTTSRIDPEAVSLLPWAISQGRGYDFALSFMRGVWAEGVDAGSDSGLKTIVTRAGLDWKTARPLIGNEDWKPVAEANRAEMMELGLWGVPSFRVGDVSAWGQDRLWLIGEALAVRK